MASRSMTQGGKWARRLGNGALALALVGLLAPAIASAMDDDGAGGGEDLAGEIIEIYDWWSTQWFPPDWEGHSGPGMSDGPSGGGNTGIGGGGGGGGAIPSDKRKLPDIRTLGEGPPLKTLESLGFECNGPLAPGDIFVCHSCADTKTGYRCICYDCQKTSGLCTPYYDCT